MSYYFSLCALKGIVCGILCEGALKKFTIFNIHIFNPS
jgi:hypothetical protein